MKIENDNWYLRLHRKAGEDKLNAGVGLARLAILGIAFGPIIILMTIVYLVNK